jgi:hypothetical protein
MLAVSRHPNRIAVPLLLLAALLLLLLLLVALLALLLLALRQIAPGRCICS